MVKQIIAVLVATILITFSGCSKKDETVTLLMAEINPPESIVGQTDTVFADVVKQLTKGSLKIDLRCTGVLGPYSFIMNEIFGDDSKIDIARISIMDYGYINSEKNVLLALPYTFSSHKHFWDFVASDLAKEIMAENDEKNFPVIPLFFGEEGFRHFFSTKKLASIEDFKGKTVRISNDKIMTSLVESLGGKPDYTPFSDLFASIQVGAVDCAEQPIVNYKANFFSEVAPNLILDGHTLGVFQVVITRKAWAKLSEAHREALMKASELAGEYCRKISQDTENNILAELKEKGVVVTEVADKTPFQEASVETIASVTKSHSELYKKILDLGKAK